MLDALARELRGDAPTAYCFTEFFIGPGVAFVTR
jgi:hypothetical protein